MHGSQVGEMVSETIMNALDSALILRLTASGNLRQRNAFCDR